MIANKVIKLLILLVDKNKFTYIAEGKVVDRQFLIGKHVKKFVVYETIK